MKKNLILSVFFCAALGLLQLQQQVMAASPVRLAITANSGSGIEQDIVDYISNQFSNDPNVVISTVNPDWYVLCNMSGNENRFTGEIHSNGTVTVKTADGQIISTVSGQKYNQDYSSQLGKPGNWQGAPLNKQLVESASREVVNSLGERATAKIKDAVQVEIQARDQIAQAESLSKNNKYDEAITVLKKLGPDTVHFKAVQKQIVQLQAKKHALELAHSAKGRKKSLGASH
jgi:hypothetical protein